MAPNDAWLQQRHRSRRPAGRARAAALSAGGVRVLVRERRLPPAGAVQRRRSSRLVGCVFAVVWHDVPGYGRGGGKALALTPRRAHAALPPVLTQQQASGRQTGRMMMRVVRSRLLPRPGPAAGGAAAARAHKQAPCWTSSLWCRTHTGGTPRCVGHRPAGKEPRRAADRGVLAGGLRGTLLQSRRRARPSHMRGGRGPRPSLDWVLRLPMQRVLGSQPSALCSCSRLRTDAHCTPKGVRQQSLHA